MSFGPRIVARCLIALLAAAAGSAWIPASAAVEYKIAADSEKGTNFVIGTDLAKFVAPAAGFKLSVLATAGSAANLRLLRYDPAVKLAIVQADVYHAFAAQSAAGNSEAAEVMRGSRIVMPLFDSELHYIVRADAPMEFIHDIKDARINGGVVGSGAVVASHAIYKAMFGAPMPAANASFLRDEEALVKLITDQSIDVVVIASGQPAPLLAGMKPEAQKFIKLLKLDPAHPASKALLAEYSVATVQAASYPKLLSADFATPAIGSYLVTHESERKDSADALARFARALCQNFPALQSKGHAKWRAVDLVLPKLAPGWSYYAPTANEIKACLAKEGRPTERAPQQCTPEQKLLGLCV